MLGGPRLILGAYMQWYRWGGYSEGARVNPNRGIE